jgi:hypothetical protein
MDYRDFIRLQSVAIAVLMGSLIAVTFAYNHHKNAFLELEMRHEMAQDKWTAEKARLESQVRSMEIAGYSHHSRTTFDVSLTR